MKYLQPEYYNLFRCVAGACENTCCMGWKIAIDEKTLSLYEVMPGKIGDKIRKSIDWREACLLQRGNRCVLLDGNGLCEVQKNCGHEALCESCREYPRHVEEFPEVREYSLSLSCPEAARLILSSESSAAEWYTEESDDLEYEDFDGKLYSFVVELRDWIREVIIDPEMTLRQKQAFLRISSHEIQRLLDEEYQKREFVSDEFVSLAGAFLKEVRMKKGEDLREDFFDGVLGYHILREEFRLLEKLYPVDSSWPLYRARIYRLLYKNGEDAFRKIGAEFEDWCRNNRSFMSDKGMSGNHEGQNICRGEDMHGCMQDDLENLELKIIDYYLFVYLTGAVYDGDIASKINLALYSGHRLREAALFQWLTHDKCLTLSDIAGSMSRYAREIEHDDENLEILIEEVNRLWQ